MTPDQWIDIAGSASQVLLAIGGFWLGWRVYKHAQLTEAINHLNAALESKNQLNTLALSSDENLQAIDSLYPDGRDQSLPAARKRWAAFLALQTHQQLFLAREAGLIPGDIADRSAEQVLNLLLSDPEVVSLVTERGFDSTFAAHCAECVEKLRSANAPTAQQSAAADAKTAARFSRG